jgi:hypothetical protein
VEHLYRLVSPVQEAKSQAALTSGNLIDCGSIKRGSILALRRPKLKGSLPLRRKNFEYNINMLVLFHGKDSLDLLAVSYDTVLASW